MSGSAGGWYTPGWYDDGEGAMRWWNGERWTEHVQPAAPVSPVAPEISPVRLDPTPPLSSAAAATYGSAYDPPAQYAAPAAYATPTTTGTYEPPQPAGSAARRRGWIIALSVAGGLVVLTIIATVTATLTARPLPGVACWDGSDAPSSDACPAFRGEDAIWYSFTLQESSTGEAADCADVDPTEYSPVGATTVLECTWSDLSGLSVYLATYPSTGEARSAWADYYSGADSTDWLVGGERIGTVWDLAGSTDDGESYWSTGTLYDDLPVGAEYFSLAPEGSSASIAAAWERVNTLDTESIEEIVVSTQ